MPNWEGSDRRSRLPANWDTIRADILKRDRWRCTWRSMGNRCPQRATDVDHIKPGDDHGPMNLRSLCATHHARKSGQEGAAAARARRAEISRRFREPADEHPRTL